MTEVKMIDLVETANEKLEKAQKNLEELEIIVALLQTNLENTVRENQELREEVATYRKGMYDMVDLFK